MTGNELINISQPIINNKSMELQMTPVEYMEFATDAIERKLDIKVENTIFFINTGMVDFSGNRQASPADRVLIKFRSRKA